MRKKIIALVALVFIFLVFLTTIPFIVFVIKQSVFPYDMLELDADNSMITEYAPHAWVYKIPTVDIRFDYALPACWKQVSSFSYTLNQTTKGALYSWKWSDATFHVYNVFGILRNLPNGYYELNAYANFDNGTSGEIDRRNFVVDTNFVDPLLRVISPMNQTTYHTHDVALTYTLNKDVMMSYYELDKGRNTDDWTSFRGNITLTGLSDGSHELWLFVQSKDNFLMKESTSYYSVNFEVDTTKQP
jgi:hypothetical protein